MVISVRYKNYEWEHEPKITHISIRKITNGAAILNELKGTGEFFGIDAYNDFKNLASLFYNDEPGVLLYNGCRMEKAYFVELQLETDPIEDYVKYSFTFLNGVE